MRGLKPNELDVLMFLDVAYALYASLSSNSNISSFGYHRLKISYEMNHITNQSSMKTGSLSLMNIYPS